jgi:prepilin-type N-terminal cleavage/methylation domain-containing protein
MKYSRGFTLIELLVVVAIVVVLSLVSIVAVNQSSDRRYPTEAEKLLIWLQQISQRSSLEGAAYGIVTKIDQETNNTIALYPVIYHRKHWVAVTSPESYLIKYNGVINWNMESDDGEELLPQSRSIESNSMSSATNEGSLEDEKYTDFLLPELAFLPDGYTEPQGEIELIFEAFGASFNYYWDTEISKIVMERREL